MKLVSKLIVLLSQISILEASKRPEKALLYFGVWSYLDHYMAENFYV